MNAPLRILFGLAAAGAAALAVGQVYNYFKPGGALSGGPTSQNVNLAAGAPFVTGPAPIGVGGTGTASTLTGLVRGGSLAFSATELSGDVLTSGSNATAIGLNVVTNAKLAQMAANTFKGNNTGALANAADLTVPQAQTLLAVPVGANPSGLIGLTAANGVATTYDRSDATHALSQAIAPTWTGPHIYTEASGITAAKINANGDGGTPDLLITGNVNGGVVSNITNTSTGTGATAIHTWSNGTHVSVIEMLGVNNTEGEYMGIGTTSQGFRFGAAGGVSDGFITNIAGIVKMTLLGPTAAAQVDMTPDTGTFTMTFGGFTTPPTCTATWARVGKLVTVIVCAIVGTSNSTSWTIGGIPAAIQPATLNTFAAVPFAGTEDASVLGQANITINVTPASATWNMSKGTGFVGWTSTLTKGTVVAFPVSYVLN